MRITASKSSLVGIISDTHGLLRPEAEELFKECDAIIHAGDVGSIEIIQNLEKIAPVTAVRGNTDVSCTVNTLSETIMINLCGMIFYVIHDLNKLDLDPIAAGVKVVVSGHTHKPKIFREDGVMYINPGSAGYYRANCPIALAMMSIEEQAISVRIVRLDL